MRSSKSRSRSKANRPRTLGNIINRVFDSSGPEGKVRGTPQQIIEKYQMLAGDAQRSNDRVAAENFSQHAEHYTRMLAEAQREMAAEQEQRQQSQPAPQNGNGNGGNRNDRNDYRAERHDQGDSDQPYAGGFIGDGDTGLVDLPESPRPQQQPRRDENRREPRPEGQPRRQDNRRDDRPREERPRDDRPREDRPREDRAREDRAREDRPRADTPREDRPRDNRRDQQPRSETPAEQPVAAAPVQEPLRFESPAQLVAQVEQAATATAAPKPRAPKPEGDAAKTTRAPRARKPKVEGASESVE